LAQAAAARATEDGASGRIVHGAKAGDQRNMVRSLPQVVLQLGL